MIVGYDPHRVSVLVRETRAALDDLASIDSSDPAASDAIATVRQMRTMLADGLLTAVRSIEAADPLVRAGDRPMPAGSNWYADWLTGAVSNPYRALSDDELLDEFERLERDVPYDDDFRPDMDHPFWDRFEFLAAELAVRVSIDADLVNRVAERASESFLIPIAVSFAGFEPELVARMLRDVTRSPSAMVDLLSNYQAYGADVMLDFLARHPHAALDAVDLTMLTELMAWPTIDSDRVGRFLHAAMAVPFRDAARLDDAFVVLQHLVTLANRRAYETGFPTDLSPTITRIVLEYVPFFITSLPGYSVVHLKDFDFVDAETPLGTYPEVLDLFGALMRDPTSLDILLASIPTFAVIGAGDNGPLGITPNDVADYVDTLRKSALNEQLEVERAADRSGRDARVAVDIAVGALQLVSAVLGPAAIGGVEVATSVLRGGTVGLVEWMSSTADLGLDDIEVVASLLVVFGLGVGVLRSHTASAHDTPTSPGGDAEGTEPTGGTQVTDDQPPDDQPPDDQPPGDPEDLPGPDESAIIELAETMLALIETRLADGASVEEIGGLIDGFGRTVRALDHEHVMDVIDDPRIVPRDIAVDRTVDGDG
ncbi:hypothetical protein [Ilumatobacter sp.]|uniref:hypothetical protein n=1 Tax=Ilumatobacter sp. TaxID=1967498 RepID=UPI003C57D009